MGHKVTGDTPREKLLKRGSTALTNAELLQLLIGSGTAQANVTKIAYKALRQLSRYGNAVSYDILLKVTGLGPARASQIIAAFELASRYPMSNKQLIIDSKDKAKGLFVELMLTHTPKLVYLTVDGAQRLIAKRSIRINNSMHPSELLRDIFSNVVIDQAAGIMIAIGYAEQNLDPTMFELSFARDVNGMAQLFSISIHSLVLMNKDAERSLRGESW